MVIWIYRFTPILFWETNLGDYLFFYARAPRNWVVDCFVSHPFFGSAGEFKVSNGSYQLFGRMGSADILGTFRCSPNVYGQMVYRNYLPADCRDFRYRVSIILLLLWYREDTVILLLVSWSGRENKSHWQLWVYGRGREVNSNRLEIHSFKGNVLI